MLCFDTNGITEAGKLDEERILVFMTGLLDTFNNYIVTGMIAM